MRIGVGYKGTSAIQTTLSTNTEILPSKPVGWTVPYSFYKLELRNYTSCTIKINDGDLFYINAGQGFTINEVDKPIYSIKITEIGTQYSWVGAF